VNISNPARIKVRDERLSIWDADMKKNDTIRIQYAAKYASVANAWKKWIGESKGIKRFNGIQKKEELEKEFTKRIQANNEWNIKYAGLLNNFKTSYNELTYYTIPNDYFIEAIMGIESFQLARGAMPLLELSSKQPVNNEDIKKQADKMIHGAEGFFKNYNTNTDKKIFAAMMELYIRNVDKAFYPAVINNLQKKYKLDFNRIADEVYAQSIFTDKKRYMDFIASYDAKKSKKVLSDPLYVIFESFWKLYLNQIAPNIQRLNMEIALLQRNYMKALREVMPEKKYYPDANSTLRLAYGKVEGYEPMDAVKYNYFTTLNGIMEKEDPKNDEFIVPEKLKVLFDKKDFGQYGINGLMPIAFVASNHTTGGNSGSPVLDAEGNLIGTNFDRVWEGTMSDLMFDPDRCRNISVDIRYTLFIIDKFAGAGYLLNEMKIVK
ncbi:MAG: S46 family peptidase, partial [Bacteroidia bacterium]